MAQITILLRDFPTFTYTRAAKDAVARHTGGAKPPRTRHKAVSFYKDRKDYTRRVTENLIDTRRWEGRPKPRGYPTGLAFPGDVLKAAMYSRAYLRERDRSGRKSKKDKTEKKAPTRHITNAITAIWRTCESCGGTADTADQLCACTTTPWDAQSTEDWINQNIKLRWISDDLGVGAYARQAIKKDTIIAEYVGEIVHTEDFFSHYQFDIGNDANTTFAIIDALRTGNWTRFINHACQSNTEFSLVRVGQGLRCVVTAEQYIRKGAEVTVHYGDEFWKSRNRQGIWCGCTSKKCDWNQVAGRERKKAGRKRLR
ncbi:hypothetical protein OPT61_g6586 [Boeremia exigua]|uniref:Uncharacterized protein n=1 Tax=Boeremia exigua TaxID=749465 RepID=A0ACC2I682_9PLEO|nr:hypothetical protein OPT61_g6586 [Boeremia exigua]